MSFREFDVLVRKDLFWPNLVTQVCQEKRFRNVSTSIFATFSFCEGLERVLFWNVDERVHCLCQMFCLHSFFDSTELFGKRFA